MQELTQNDKKRGEMTQAQQALDRDRAYHSTPPPFQLSCVQLVITISDAWKFVHLIIETILFWLFFFLSLEDQLPNGGPRSSTLPRTSITREERLIKFSGIGPVDETGMPIASRSVSDVALYSILLFTCAQCKYIMHNADLSAVSRYV